MSARHLGLTALLSTCLTLTVIAASLLFWERATAAPGRQVISPASEQNVSYMSVSSLAFVPVRSTAAYRKDSTRQLLLLTTQGRDFSNENNVFVAPLSLPDGSQLMGLTFFGEDFDNQGAVIIRLKRCDHGQARCIVLAEPTSTNPFALGQFETVKVTNLNEVVNNNLYAYILELELTALGNSGLRSVRLELAGAGSTPSEPGPVETWRLAGEVTNFLIPNTTYARVRVCTHDLSHLPNVTHYPFLVVDGQQTRLSGNSCVTASGLNIEIRRSFNTGPSSGTYQIFQ